MTDKTRKQLTLDDYAVVIETFTNKPEMVKLSGEEVAEFFLTNHDIDVNQSTYRTFVNKVLKMEWPGFIKRKKKGLGDGTHMSKTELLGKALEDFINHFNSVADQEFIYETPEFTRMLAKRNASVADMVKAYSRHIEKQD